jgi:hypothetical protein
VPGKMAYLGYTSDDGTVYALKTRHRYLGALNQTAGGVAVLGFQDYASGRDPLPRGMKPRGLYVQDASGGATRFVPCGNTTAPGWTGGVDTLQIDYSGIGTMTDARIIGRRPEKPAQLPHIINNLSDAS